MAESYKGLTIRIGGDTTKLTKALGVANSTISGTQSEIRKLDQALKLDPSNIEAFNLKMGYMEQQATAAAMKLYQLQKAAEEVGQREVSLGDDRESVQTVEQLAKATENAHLQAQQLKAAYNQVKDSLSEMYTELTGYNEKAAKQISETIGSDLAESIGVNSTPEAIQGFVDSLATYFNDLNGVIKKPKKSIEEVSAELQRLRKEYSVTDSDSKKLKIQEQFEKLRDEITQFQGLTINFEEGKTDIKDIEHTIEQLDKLGSMGFDTEQIEAYKQEVSRLKVAYVETLDELKKANEVARFADLQVEIEKAKASVKGLAKALADMKEPSQLMRGMADLTEQTDALQTSYKGLASDAKSLESAFGINPDNTEAQAAAMKAWSDAELVATERAAALREQIDQFDREKIDGYADATKSVQQQLIDASVAHANAEEKVSAYKGAVEATVYALRQLDLNASETAKILEKLDPDNSKMHENAINGDAAARAEYKQWLEGLIDRLRELNEEEAESGNGEALEERRKMISAAQDLANALDGLTEAERNETKASEEHEYAKQRRDLAGLDAELIKTTGNIDNARVAIQRLASSVAKTTTSNFTKTVFGGFDERLGTFDSAMSTIQNRVKVMGDAMKVFPDTTELAKKRMVELAEAVSVGESEARNLEAVIKSIENDVGDGGFDMFEGLTGSEALDGAERRVESLVVQLDAATSALAKMADGSKGFEAASNRVKDLEQRLQEAREATVNAAAYKKWEEYRDRLEGVRVTVQGLKNDLYGMSTNVLDSAVQSVEEIRSAFGEARMPDFARQFEGLDDVIEDAKRRIAEIDDQISKGFADDGAFEERAQQVTRLLEAIDKQGKLVNKTMADFGLDAKVDELTEKYGDVTEAIQTLSEKVIATAGSMEVLTNQARQFASQHDLGEQWLDDFTKLRLSIEDVPEEMQAVYESMQKLSGKDLDNRIDLGLAIQIKYLQDLESQSQETFRSIRQDASQKIRLDVDDTAVKNIRTILKDATGSAFDTNNLGEYSSKLSYIEAALKGVSDTANDLKERVKFDPANATLMATATDAFRQKVVLLNERLAAAKQLMAQFEDSGVKYASLSMAELATRTEAAKQKVDQLDDIAQRLDDAIKEAAEEFDKLNDAGKDTSKVKERLDALEDGLKEVREAAGEAAQEVREFTQAGEYRNLGNVVATTGAHIRETEAAAKEMGNGFKNAFGTETMQAIQQIGQAAERVASEVIESANTIDAAYRDMRKTVNGTEAEFGALLESAIQFSQAHAVTADTILEMEALGGQLGITVDKLQEFGEVASNLDIATDIGAEDIALQLGQITNLMSDLDYDTFQNFGDALVRLGNNMPTTESAIMDVAQRMAAVANVTSMSTPDLLAWSAAIASTGQRSESAATAINKTITGIGTAVATGGDTLNQFAAIANMSAEQFEEAWKNSSSDTLEAFVKGLAALTDDSTAAIQALESVGITGVRQETALLSLSQTIQNLDNATLMASDAFNGISDEWGNAGDAANEANNKSQGFSGTLQILKNNASALAATLGDSLVEPMKLAANILGLVTDALNSMGGPAKTLIVTLGGLTAVLGTILPAFDHLAEGWKKFSDHSGTAQKASGLLSSAIEKLADMFGVTTAKSAFLTAAYGEQAVAGAGATAATVAESAALGTEAVAAGAATVATNLFSKALMAVPGVAVIAAVTAAFALLADVLGSTVKRAGEIRELANATIEANNAAKTMKDSYGKAVGEINVKPAKQSLHELRDETSALISDLTEFENGVADTWKSIGSDSAYIDEYASKIKEIGNSGSITEERLAELKNAVAKYNELTGASVQVIDEQTGALNLNNEALDQVTDAYKRQAEAKAYSELYDETIKKQVEIREELNETKEKLDELKEKYGVDLGGGTTFMLMYTDEARELQSQVDLLTERQVNYNKRIEEYSKHLGVASGATMDYEAAVASAGFELGTFDDLTEAEREALAKIQSKLIDTGDSLKNYGDLNVEQVRAIIDAWDGSAKSVQKALDDMASSANGALDPVAKATDEQYNHIKDLYDQLATEQKRIRDDYYDSEKQRLDDEYENQKRILDDEYDDKKNAYDKEYDIRKQELDDEYTATKNTYDKSYDLLKRELDKEHDLRKRELDKEYDDRKKTLDKEYDAAKDASDAWLKQYKKNQEAEVKAFKDATDARVKEIDREYEAKKKLLNAEYEGYDSDIDDRIKAIEAEQDAEDRALKEKERQEKLAELGKAVETAKGAKKREEAEKALQDYKDELAREDVKEQRQAQIEKLNDQKAALKDQLSDREEHLKNTYDAVKEEYKAERDAQLDAMKEANDAEYDIVKASEDAKLEAIKESNSAVLADLKQANSDKLEEIKLNNQDILAAAKLDNDAQLLEVKRRHEAELQTKKDTNEQKLKELKRVHEDELEDLKLQNENVLKVLKRGHEDELAVIKNGYDKTLKALKDGTLSYADALEQITGKTIENISKMGDGAESAAKAAVDDAASTSVGKFSKTMAEAAKAAGATEGQLAKTAREMLSNGQITLKQYLGLIDGSASAVSTSIEGIFQQSGIALGNGLGAIAQQMLSNGQITLQEYLDIINGVPGAVGAVCNESGLAIANQLGLIQPNVKASSQGVADGVKAPFDALPGYMKDAAVPNTANAIVGGLGSSDTVDKVGNGTGAVFNAITGKWTELSKENAPKLGESTGVEIANGIYVSRDSFGKAIDATATTGLVALEKRGAEFKGAGESHAGSYVSGLGIGGEKAATTAGKIGDSIVKSFDRTANMKVMGTNTIIGYLNGMVEEYNKNGNSTVAKVAGTIIDTFAKKMKINSPSKVFAWMAEMDILGFTKEWERESGNLIGSVGDVADDMVDEMAGMSFEQPDLTFDVSEMDREYAAFKEMLERREQLLSEHAARMEELSKTIGDIQLPMAAAYDAMGRISAAKASSVDKSVSNIDNSSYAPVININIPEVVVREQADIDRLSQQIALRVQRSLNARIG